MLRRIKAECPFCQLMIMLDSEGIPLDNEVVKEWLEHVKEQMILEAVFDPMPAKAL